MNLGEWTYKRALTYPDRPFLKQGDLRYNNREFNEKVNQMAHALIGLGVKKGDRVATLMVNSSEFLEIFFACAKTGMIILPLNYRLAVPELGYILNDCTPSVLIYSSDFIQKVELIKASVKKIKHFFIHKNDQLSGDPSVAEFVATFPKTEPVLQEETEFQEPLLIMYTSGTTGDPKGAVLSHQNFFFGAIHSMISYGTNATYKSLVIAPLFHIGALAASATPIIYAGGSLVIESFDNPSEISDLIFKEKINYVFAVPVMYEMMAKTPRWEKVDFSHVHFFISGGASMPVPLIHKYQKEKGIRFAQAYAMTETLRLTTLDLEDSERKAGSVGKEVFHILMRIVDDDGNDVPSGEPGEIIVKGPTIFLKYWNKPNETENAFRGGWFHTGDMGKRDEENFLYIVGRKIDLIISSGENIYSLEVERAIESIPQVAEAAAVAMPDPKRGEVVAAFVLLNQEASLSENELIEDLHGKIAHFKIPKKVFFVKDFPRNSAGKILKKKLRAQLNP
jgi:fatty-acyl-CoA synthase